MAVVSLAEVNSWLAETKFVLPALNAEVEENARTIIFAELADVYDTSGWTAENNTPELVKKMVAMQTALYEYERAVSEDLYGADSDYTKRLWRRLESLMKGVVGGAVQIGQSMSTSLTEADSLLFFPTDTEDEFDPWTDDDDHRRKFQMGQVF